MASSENRSNSQPSFTRMFQNFLLIWVDSKVHSLDRDAKHTLVRLRGVVNEVTLCSQPADCLGYLQQIQSEKAFVITSGDFGPTLLPQIHSIASLEAIFVFCINETQHQQWAKKWSKIRGVYTSITAIITALEASVKRLNRNTIPISFVELDESATKTDLNSLEPGFMYTQIFKNTLLDMKQDEQGRAMMLKSSQNKYRDNTNELAVINEFSRHYRPDMAIWWYTRECFIYHMVNRALRILEGDNIVNMAFFIHDLHRQLEQLHKQQITHYNGKTFVVFRGQGLTKADFSKLQKRHGGLMAFNSFLSTSGDKALSLMYAESAIENSDLMGILFVINIDPEIISTPFANISEISYFPGEAEILFSMHTVFRIGIVNSMEKNDRLFEVTLTLTNDQDPQLHALTMQIEKEIGGQGWARIGCFLMILGQPQKAEELYLALFNKKLDEWTKAYYYNQLGYIKSTQGNYKKAVRYYKKSLSISEKKFPSNDSDLTSLYNNIGLVCYEMRNYPKALSYFKKGLAIQEKNSSASGADRTSIYNNIGLVYCKMRDYSQALSYYGKASDINRETLVACHPHIAIDLNNIAGIYAEMREYSKALSYYQKALDISQKTLPTNHPSLATSYYNIGMLYSHMEEYSLALPYLEQALQIQELALPPKHPQLMTVRESIKLAKKNCKI